MCGIAGWYSAGEQMTTKTDILEKMSSTLCRRGPDEHGMYIDPHAAMIHRRLSVIDPEHGKQPFTGANNIVLVYNGEIYNADALRQELISMGYEFHSHSDTEVLYNSYLCWGESCAEKLNGIFAFAFYNERERSLFLARDPIGVKPLFYYSKNGEFIFASEIKTLLANPIVEPVINETGLMEVFFLGPGRTPSSGVFRDIEELCPGECAVYKDGNLTKRKYFRVTAAPHEHNKAQTVEYVKYLITDAIKLQLVSDVPLCTFLSGGLDSSIISTVAAREYSKCGEKLSTYSVNYTDNAKYFRSSKFQPNSDEEFIDIMVDHIGSNHENVVLDNRRLFMANFDAVDARDLPGMADVDGSMLMFCREVKKKFTVALSGECADELFGGYPWYHDRDILFSDSFPWSHSQEIRRSVLKDGFLPKGEEYVRARYEETVKNTDTLPTDSPFQKRMREMFMLNINWFMQTLLDRKDRCSMYSGLEVRVPFCDHRIVRYAYNMPWELKSPNGREKGIVREAFSDILPESIAWRKKSPYPKTHNPKYMAYCVRAIKNILDDPTSPIRDVLDKNGIDSIIENPYGISSPWYGQLMKAPQILAYLAQVDYWMRQYRVVIR